MLSFGEKLRSERERRETTLAEVAEATRIDIAYLEALEKNEFAALPGRNFGKLYIRAYGDLLGFAAGPLIADYDREQLRQRREQRGLEAAPVEPESVDEQPVEEPSRGRPVMRAAFAAGLAIAAVWIGSSWIGGSRPSTEPVAQPPPVPVAQEPEPPVGATVPVVEAAAAATRLSVTDFGIGRRVVNRRLVERGDRFEEGAVVFFSTRVVGGVAGERIRHVWFREGKPVQRVDLEVGGPHWRTHSRKTLWGVGDWAVEARDPDGHILARATFSCVERS